MMTWHGRTSNKLFKNLSIWQKRLLRDVVVFAFCCLMSYMLWCYFKWNRIYNIILDMFRNLMSYINVWQRIWKCLVICHLSGISTVYIIAVIVRDFTLHEKILQNYLYYTDPNGAVRHWSKMGLNFFQFKRRYRWNHWTGNPHRIL